jgi:hypothetical protein
MFGEATSENLCRMSFCARCLAGGQCGSPRQAADASGKGIRTDNFLSVWRRLGPLAIIIFKFQ